jgi:hypothetical protein
MERNQLGFTGKPNDTVMWVQADETRPTIDWDCPCVASIKEGSCGQQVMAAMDCLMANRDCPDKFIQMNECMLQFPTEYAEYFEGKE